MFWTPKHLQNETADEILHSTNGQMHRNARQKRIIMNLLVRRRLPEAANGTVCQQRPELRHFQRAIERKYTIQTEMNKHSESSSALLIIYSEQNYIHEWHASSHATAIFDTYTQFGLYFAL